jgi:hypothetical protein
MWYKIEGSNSFIGSYQFDEESKVIHIIKLGFENKFCVIHDDPFHLTEGGIEVMCELEICCNYGIIL